MTRRVRLARAGQGPQRPGPKPIIAKKLEDDIEAWIAARQAVGHPPTCYEITVKANKISTRLYNTDLSRHWPRRFLERHPRSSVPSAVVLQNASHTMVGWVELYIVLMTVSVDDATTISRDAALSIASEAWATHLRGDNLVAGFATAGIWPVALPKMLQRLERYTLGDLPASYQVATWVRDRELIRNTVLTTPYEPPKRAQRKRVRVAGELLLLARLREVNQEKNRKRRQQTKRKGPRSQSRRTALPRID